MRNNMKNNPDEFKTTSFSIRLDIPDTDLRERDVSYLIDKALRPIIDDNKFENVEIDVVDITERT